MFEQDLYVREKLKEIEPARPLSANGALAPAPRKPALAPLARPLGRALHRMGHRLEAWAAPPSADGESRRSWRSAGG